MLLAPDCGFPCLPHCSEAWHEQLSLVSQASTKKLEESSPSPDPPCSTVLFRSGPSPWELHPSMSMVQLIQLSKWFAGHSFYCLTPESQPFPIVHTYCSFGKQTAVFLCWRDKGKIWSQRERGTFLVLFLPLFVVLAPSQLTVFYFLSSVCVNFLFFFLHSSKGKGFLSLNILFTSAYFWMLIIKS